MYQTTTARALRVNLPVCRSGIGLGTGVMTADGEIPVEFLEPGDRIVTLDAGHIPLAALVARKVSAKSVIRVRPSVIDPEGHGRDYLIAARQQVILRGWQARAMFGKDTALVRAEQLVDGAHMTRLADDTNVRLFQLYFKDGRHILPLSEMRQQVVSARLPARAPA